MKTGNPTALRHLRACVRSIWSLRPGRKALLHFFACAVLSAAGPGYGPTAAGACLLGACERCCLLPCVLGTVAADIALWGLRAAASPCAVSAVVLCVRLLVPGKKQRLAVPIAGAAACAAVGLFPAVTEGAPAILFMVLHTAMIAGGIVLFRAALIQKSYPARVGAICALLPGLAALRLPGGWCAAAAALAWAASAGVGPLYACAGVAVLSAAAPDAAPCYASVCLCALLFRLLRKTRGYACAAACGIYLLSGFWCRSLGFSACASAGTLLALLLSPDRVLPVPPRVDPPKHPARDELRQAARALALAADMLDVADADPRREFSAILDAAAGQVCCSCAKNSACGKIDDAALQNAARILARGAARAEDLPFRDRCIHPEAFLTAVNDAMDVERAGHRFRRRLRESRRAAQSQYRLMSKLLGGLSDKLYAPDTAVNFSPQISVQASGRGGSAISGDRGAAFEGPGGTYYVLLCDGMGTGEIAARESGRAVSLIHRMLLSGADAESALRALNGIYLLRDDGCFSTVDLLRVNLTSGDAILYKWGAAASYLKRSRGLRRLGGVCLPPGLDETESYEKIHLNLDHGGVLVLLSDGLSGKQTQRRLEHCDSLTPEDVARSIFAGREPGADDCTAVAIRLRRSVQREPVPV